MKTTNPDICAFRRRKSRNFIIPSVLWLILVTIFELTVFYDYTLEKLGIVTAIGIWILLSLIVPIRLGLFRFLFDYSWEGTVIRIKDLNRVELAGLARGVGGRYVYELDLFIRKSNGRKVRQTLISKDTRKMWGKNTIGSQLYHVGDRVVYLRGTYVPFIVHRDGEAPPAVCVLCGKDNPAGTETCLSCHADILKPEELTT